MSISSAPNINHLWAQLIVEELIRNKVDYFCVSPGSRSTPLAWAVGQHKRAKHLIHFDERAGAFRALGYSSASKIPSVIVTTSGSAVGNLFPAVIEASKKKVPMIVITADRPPELRFTGSNQTIDQVKIFGDYVRWQFDIPCPTTDIDPAFILTTIDQALAQASHHLPGPVHLNCMFREPLAPTKTKGSFASYIKGLKEWERSKSPYTHYTKKDKTIHSSEIDEIVTRFKRIKSGIIAVGKLKTEEDRKKILNLSQQLQWPIFPDVTSGLRLGSSHENVIHYFDQILLSSNILKRIKPDGILQVGGRMTSKRFANFIDEQNLKEYIMVLNHPLRNDPGHRVSLRIESSVSELCDRLKQRIIQRPDNPMLKTLHKKSIKVRDILNGFTDNELKVSEPSIARLITKHIPKNHALFLASSLPVREVDMYADLNQNNIPIGSNRGASGIDGTISSAIGFSNGLDKNVTLLIGDLSFLYDLNALAMLKDLNKPMVIVIFNNNGGGIFSFLPIAKEKNVFEDLFATPHHLKFESAAKLFNLNYYVPKTNKEFLANYKHALKEKASTIIEITTDRQSNVNIQKKLQQKIIEGIS